MKEDIVPGHPMKEDIVPGHPMIDDIVPGHPMKGNAIPDLQVIEDVAIPSHQTIGEKSRGRKEGVWVLLLIVR